MKKEIGQSALEHLMTYAMALVIIIIVGAALIILINPSSLGAGRCTNFDSFLVRNFVISAQGIHLVLVNKSWQEISDMDFSLSGETPGSLLNQNIKKQEVKEFIIPGTFSEDYQVEISLSYRDSTGTVKTERATCSGRTERRQAVQMIKCYYALSGMEPPYIEVGSTACFDYLHEKSLTEGTQWGETMAGGPYEVNMVKGEQQTFRFRLYNGADTRQYAHLELKILDDEKSTPQTKYFLPIDGLFEWSFTPNQDNCYILEPYGQNGSNVQEWVALKPKVDSGTYTIWVCNSLGLPCNLTGGGACGKIQVTVTG